MRLCSILKCGGTTYLLFFLFCSTRFVAVSTPSRHRLDLLSAQMPSTLVNVQGIDKCTLLRALWERQILCEDFRARKVPVLTGEKVKVALADDEGYVHFVCGKYIKVDFSQDLVDSVGYNAHAGAGVLESVVKGLMSDRQGTFLSALQNAQQPVLHQLPGVTRVEADGLCYWRCILSYMATELRLSAEIDFAVAKCEEVYRTVDVLRSNTADFVERLRSDHPEEWSHIAVTAQGLLDERGETLAEWLLRMRTPVKDLEGSDRWADELVFAVTPRMLGSLGFDVDIRVKHWVTTDLHGRVVRFVNSQLSDSPSSIVINLRYYLHDNGDGYHYDLLPNIFATAPSASHTRILTREESSDTESDEEETRHRTTKRGRRTTPPVTAVTSVDLRLLNKRLLEAARRGDERDAISSVRAGATALRVAVRIAAKAGHADVVGVLLGDGHTQDFLWAALGKGARHGHLGVVKAAVAAGARLSSAFAIAVENGHLDIVEWLFNRGWCNVNSTSVCTAIYGGHRAVVDFLVENRLLPDVPGTTRDVNSRIYDMLCAAAACGHLNLVEAVIGEVKRDRDASGDEVNKALCLAALGGHLDVVKVLVSNIDFYDACVVSALHQAAGKGHVSVVNFFLRGVASECKLPEDALCFRPGSGVGTVEVSRALRKHVATVYSKYGNKYCKRYMSRVFGLE